MAHDPLTDRLTVWTWRPGERWAMLLDCANLDTACSAVVREGRHGSAIAFSAVLEAANPNRMSVDEIEDMAELIHRPLPDLLGARFAA